jgi:hypothetical protein
MSWALAGNIKGPPGDAANAPVQSVFGRLGAVIADPNDYAAYYQPLGSIPVSSVFGRAGDIVAQAGDYTAAQVTNALDSTQAYANPAWLTALAWTKITGAPATESPLTFSMSLSRTGNNVTLLGDTSVGSVGPSFYYGTNSGGTRGWWVLPSFPVTSVFTRTGAVVAAAGDYSAFYASLSGSYTNPAWIASLAWSKITGAPAFEPALGNPGGNGWVLSSTTTGTRSWVLPGEPALGNPATSGYVLSSTTGGVRSWIAPAAAAEPPLGNPTTSGNVLSSTTAGVRSWKGVVDSFRGRTGAVTSQSDDYSAWYAQLTAGNIFTLNQTMPGFILPIPSSTAKGRVTTLPGVANWIGYTLNASYTGGWNLDDTSLDGWILKLGSTAGDSEFAVYQATPGVNPRTPTKFFSVAPGGLITVAGRITGVGTPTGATDAATKGYVDGLAFEVPLTFQYSLSRSGNTINLVADVATPGNRKVYGTDLNGARGWWDHVSSFNGRVGAVGAQSNDYSGFYPLLTGSYADPTWITSLAWSKITGAPATGVSSVFGRSGAVVAAVGDYSSFYASLGAGIPVGGTAGQVLQKDSATDYDTSWITLPGGGNVSNSGTPTAGQMARWTNATTIEGQTPNVVHITPADPGGTASTAGVMVGLGQGVGGGAPLTIQVKYSGIVLVMITGRIVNNLANAYGSTKMRYGTGTPPAYNTAQVGTVIGNTQYGLNLASANQSMSFTCSAIVTGLTKGTTYWFDLALASSSGSGVANVLNLTTSIIEL